MKIVHDPECHLLMEKPKADAAAKHLLGINVLFYTGKHISPQHWQIEKAIRKYVRVFCQKA
eukprot:3224564-Ditylum_brightwellii.AAC.1